MYLNIIINYMNWTRLNFYKYAQNICSISTMYQEFNKNINNFMILLYIKCYIHLNNTENHL